MRVMLDYSSGGVISSSRVLIKPKKGTKDLASA